MCALRMKSKQNIKSQKKWRMEQLECASFSVSLKIGIYAFDAVHTLAEIICMCERVLGIVCVCVRFNT